MKYTRLTQEQFFALENEFIRFLATQSITGPEWESIKANTPKVAEAQLDVFSDLIWEGVLAKVEYLENTSKDQCFMFRIATNGMELIHLKIKDDSKDLTINEDLAWACQNVKHRSVHLSHGQKKFDIDKNEEVFKLIKQGAQIKEGHFFSAFKKLL